MRFLLSSSSVLVILFCAVTACSDNPADASHLVHASQTPKPITVYIAEAQDIYNSSRYWPKSVLLSGDSTYELSNMTWSTWSATAARGKGIALINDCNPNCAAGRIYHVPVVATFTRPVKACKAQYGATATTIRYFWSRADLTYPSGLPAPVHDTYGLWDFSSLIDMADQSCL